MRLTLLCKTPTERMLKQAEFGTRFSVLSWLFYFDAIKYTIIDMMHNMLLGTPSRLIKIWLDLGLLDKASLRKIQDLLDQFKTPNGVGRIPHKVASKFSGFTADQYRLWTIVFSIFCLTDILPKEHLECWRNYVLACAMLVTRCIRRTTIDLADEKLMTFCEQFVQLYDEPAVTINMHLHGHIKECLLDYGPVYATWLFSFERYNGLLGSYPTNKRNVEKQLMKHFLLHDAHEHVSNFFPTSEGRLNAEEVELFKFVTTLQDSHSATRGSLTDSVSNYDWFSYTKLSHIDCQIRNQDWSLTIPFSCGKPVSSALSDCDQHWLTGMYQHIYPNATTLEVLVSKRNVGHVRINNVLWGCKGSRSHRSAFILAFWCGDNLSIMEPGQHNVTPRPAIINELFINIVSINGVMKKHVIAKVNWYLPISLQFQSNYGKPVELWRIGFEDPGVHSFLPIQRLHNHFAYTYVNINNHDMLVMCPLVRTF